jgi:hypothetical protein
MAVTKPFSTSYMAVCALRRSGEAGASQYIVSFDASR